MMFAKSGAKFGLTRATALAALIAGFTPVAGDPLMDLGLGLLVAPAEAVVGMPATPVSYAGVARRTTRRAVYTTAAVTAAPPPPPATTTVVVTQPPAAGCTKVVEKDGTTTYRCP